MASTFDEEWYLRRYQDVAEAIASGRIPSALAHYERHGRLEGRQPAAPPAGADLQVTSPSDTLDAASLQTSKVAPMTESREIDGEIPVAYQSHDGTGADSDSAKKLIALQLPQLIGKSFLDIGCNEGFFCNQAKQKGASRVVGIDQDKSSVEKAKSLYPGIEFLCQSWAKLPAGPFDVILHSSAMHYAADPYQHIKRIHEALADDGLFILECGIAPFNHPMESGVYELGGAFWERANRNFDTVFHPSEALLRSSLLIDFSVRAAGLSVVQRGDPFPRKVFHCRKFKPIVLLIGGAGHAGKTTFAVELQRYGIPTFSSDIALERLATNQGLNNEVLWSVIKSELDPTYAVPLYGRLDEPDMAPLFAGEIVAMMPKNHRMIVLEGFAFGLKNIRERTTELLRNQGFVVHCALI
jgi:SAM-dependent methyltransferase